ncbi:MAG: SP_1767 family glycosyltransferase [Clostridia bacterium]
MFKYFKKAVPVNLKRKILYIASTPVCKYVNYKFKHFLNITNIDETVNVLINENKSIARYGDGELSIIKGDSISFQKYDERLATRLSEIIVCENYRCLIAIPGMLKDGSDSIKYEHMFWARYFLENYKFIKKTLNYNIKYNDTNITRVYFRLKDKSLAENRFKKLQQIWQDKDVIIVEGKYSRLGVGNDLLGNVKSIKRILCKACDAFDDYDEILKTVKKYEKSHLIIIALGPTATVLAYDLSLYGYKALDLGHVDIEYEWFLKKTIDKINIQDKYTNEAVGGDIVSDITDEMYLSQIFDDIAK